MIRRTLGFLLLLAVPTAAWSQVGSVALRGGTAAAGGVTATSVSSTIRALDVNIAQSVALTLGTGSATIGAVTQASGPWTSNVTQFGSTNVSTGTGTSGSGIPRITVAQDSFLDPCGRNTKSYVGITQTGNTQLVTGVASTRIYVCSFNVVTATTQNISLVAGTGTACATTTVGVPGITGGATAATGWNMTATGGIVLGNGAAAIGQTTVNADNLCLFQSGAGQVSGGLTYVTQ